MYYVIAILLLFLTAVLARAKGYNRNLWFMAGGPLGLILMIFVVPDTTKISDPQEKFKKLRDGNILGTFLSILSLIFLCWQAESLFFPTSTSGGAPSGGALFLILILLGATSIVGANISEEFFTFKTEFWSVLGTLLVAVGTVILVLTLSIVAAFGENYVLAK